MREVAEKIASEIRDRGIIPFARFMELALYCPVYGYYEAEADTLGRRGDYFTSVSVGPLFGELLAWQLAQWLAADGGPFAGGPQAPKELQDKQEWGPALAEAGAHRGDLARDILRWFRARRPALFEFIDYWVVEPSERRQKFQTERLAEFGKKVRWVKSVAELGQGPAAGAMSSKKGQGFRGIFFSNELLDSMPVHRLSWEARERGWREWGVTLQGKDFAWARMDPEQSEAAALWNVRRWIPEDVLDVLPDGFKVEFSPAAERWWQEAAGVLQTGRLLTFDYGLTLPELLSPARSNGTLRAYRAHRVEPDVLAVPGAQDITAHVNFTAIERAGLAAGLKPGIFATQGQFLTQVASQFWKEPEEGFSEWTAARRRQFQTLTHPEHLGERFRVFMQSR